MGVGEKKNRKHREMQAGLGSVCLRSAFVIAFILCAQRSVKDHMPARAAIVIPPLPSSQVTAI